MRAQEYCGCCKCSSQDRLLHVQWAVFNSTLGAKSDPWGPSSPLGAKFTPGGQVHPWRPSSTLGAKFIPGDQVHPWGPSSPLWAKFSPRGKLLGQTRVVKNWPQIAVKGHFIIGAMYLSTFLYEMTEPLSQRYNFWKPIFALKSA
jgi:hypothetical protein